jgi:hypothetical protein
MSRVEMIFAALAFAWMPSVHAVAQDCGCGRQASFGSIVAVEGAAMIAGVDAVEEAAVGLRLGQGSLLFTGAEAKVVVRFGGGCDMAVGPDATLSIGRVDGALCPVVSAAGRTLMQSAEPGAPVAEPAAQLEAMRPATVEISP